MGEQLVFRGDDTARCVTLLPLRCCCVVVRVLMCAMSGDLLCESVEDAPHRRVRPGVASGCGGDALGGESVGDGLVRDLVMRAPGCGAAR